MKIRSLIAGAAAALVVLLIAAAATVALVVEHIKMGGPLQIQSQLASDYIADILPPPEYIIEPYLEATLALAHPDEVNARRARLSALHRSYDERHRFWLDATMDPDLRDRLTITTHAPAQQFWTELEGRFLPAVAAGRSDDAKASYRRLTSAYDRHRAAVDAAVGAATAFQTALKTNSARSVRNAQFAAGGAAIAILAGVLGFLWMIDRRAIAPLDVAASEMRRLSGGDYASVIPVGVRRDEIGALMAGLEAFRLAAIAKRDAEDRKVDADREQKRVVDTVSRHLADLAGGDLTATIAGEFPPDYAVLKSNFNDALDQLRTLIGSVGDSAAAIRLGSGEIAQASEDLARRTEGNAASLEQAAGSLSAVDDRIRASADVAAQTVVRADQAIATVGGGRTKASEARQAMARVSGSAKGIDDVIEGLDKIAFQTRVLAMNAAVEAGRAGDAGRGFAVVADLVSALAMRAEEEAKRARDQLTVTQADIVTAVDAVTQVDEALDDISSDVGHVHQLLATMASDQRDQSVAISGIAETVGIMDRSTQQNAAMVEQTSAAARNLANEVGGLARRADRFKVGERAAGSVARASSLQSAEAATV
jgi:methyl-accepting chemotaxis protein